LNEDGEVVEATGANFFWVDEGGLWTPPLESGVLGGITRAVVLELARGLGYSVSWGCLRHSEMGGVEAAFLTSSIRGLRSVGSIDGQGLGESGVVDELRGAYGAAMEAECGGRVGGRFGVPVRWNNQWR